MTVKIYFKKDPNTPQAFEITLEEFKRLSGDFQNFLQHGTPKGGLYQCHRLVSEIKIPDPIALRFMEIVLIQ